MQARQAFLVDTAAKIARAGQPTGFTDKVVTVAEGNRPGAGLYHPAHE